MNVPLFVLVENYLMFNTFVTFRSTQIALIEKMSMNLVNLQLVFQHENFLGSAEQKKLTQDFDLDFHAQHVRCHMKCVKSNELDVDGMLIGLRICVVFAVHESPESGVT